MSLNKYKGGAGNQNINNKLPSIDIISFGTVALVDDTTDGGRIKVRIKGIDDHIGKDADLPFAFPIIPKHFNVTPRIGELVFIFKRNISSTPNLTERFFIGPIISQPQKIKKDSALNAKALFSNGIVGPEEAPSVIPEALGIYPKDVVTIQGRDNADLLFKPSEVLIRAGKFVANKPLVFNNINQGYIQIKNSVITKKGEDSNPDTLGSVTNIVSNKINLISHDGSPKFVVNGQDDSITQKELTKIINTAHPLIYGDTLVEFLNLVKTYIVNHVHGYHNLPAVQTQIEESIIKFNFETLLSKNIRIN